MRPPSATSVVKAQVLKPVFAAIKATDSESENTDSKLVAVFSRFCEEGVVGTDSGIESADVNVNVNVILGLGGRFRLVTRGKIRIMSGGQREPSKRCVLLIFFSVVGVLVSVTIGQSRLIFPRLSFEEGTLTGVAVLNPNSTAAVLTFTAYDHIGRVIEASGFDNPREITIEAGLQFADVTVSLFGTLPADTVGWFEAGGTGISPPQNVIPENNLTQIDDRAQSRLILTR